MEATYDIRAKSSFCGAGLLRDSPGLLGQSTSDRGEFTRPHPAPTLPARPGGQTTGGRTDVAARLLPAPLLIQRSQALLALEEGSLLAWLRANPARDSLGFCNFADLVRELLQTPPRSAYECMTVYQTCQQAPALKAAFLDGEVSFCQVLVLAAVVRRQGHLRPRDGGEDGCVGEDGGGGEDGGVGEDGGRGGFEDGGGAGCSGDEPSTGRAAESWDEALLAWYRAHGRPPVATLRRLVRQRLVAGDSEIAPDSGERTVAETSTAAGTSTVAGVLYDEALDPPFRGVSFQAPPALAVQWEHALEMARRVLGYDAPRYACVEVILIEAASEALGRVQPSEEPGRIEDSRIEDRRIEDNRIEDKRIQRIEDSRIEDKRIQRVEDGRVEDSRIQRIEDGPPQDIPFPQARPCPPPRVASDPVRDAKASARVAHTLTQVEQYLENLNDLMEAGEPADPWDAVQRILQIQRLSRPGRVLLGRLLRDIRDTRTFEFLNHFREDRPPGNGDGHKRQQHRRPVVEDYCRAELRMSERSARDLRREAELFEDCPDLARAYAERTLGIGQAVRIGRLVGSPIWARPTFRRRRSPFERFIRRASQVTARQFERECRFLERVHEFFPQLCVLRHGPISGRVVERILLRELEKSGWTPARTERALDERGLGEAAALGPVLYRKGKPRISRDPAHNPLTMRRMEAVLDLLMTAHDEDEKTEAATVAQVQEAERKEAERTESARTSARTSARQTSAHPSDRETVDRNAFAIAQNEAVVERQTSAHSAPEWPRPRPGWVRIRFSAPEPVAEHWRAALEWVQERCIRVPGAKSPDTKSPDTRSPDTRSPDTPDRPDLPGPFLPTWAAVALLLDGAVSEWSRTDPESIPTEYKILERDESRCGTPACARRRQLESHHVEFKSHGGSDGAHNRKVLCHGCHRLVHLGYIRVTGTAPGGLHWEIGRRGSSPDAPPILRLFGARFEDDHQ